MWTLQDARNRFGAVVAAALAGTPQEVTRRGKPAVVVLSAEAYRRLVQGAPTARESFADHLMACPGGPGGPGGPIGPDGRGGDIPRAGVALRDGATVVTGNVSDFAPTGLRIEHPFQG